MQVHYDEGQFDFEGHSCLECGQQPSGLLRIVEHQLTPSTIEPSDSAIANDREYGRAGSLGHDARLMPAKYVRPYSRGQKKTFAMPRRSPRRCSVQRCRRDQEAGARLRISESGITQVAVSVPACAPARATPLGSACAWNR